MKELLGYKLEDCKSIVESCDVCPLARHVRQFFPISSSKSIKAFQLLHLDVWGPYSTPTFDENKYFLTIVDDFSRVTWIFHLKLKGDVINVLKYFLKQIQTQFIGLVQTVRSDNGGEFVSSEMQDLFKSLGIVHQRTCSYIPQQNDVAKRKHKHLLEVAREIRFQGHIPLHFWTLYFSCSICDQQISITNTY